VSGFARWRSLRASGRKHDASFTALAKSRKRRARRGGFSVMVAGVSALIVREGRPLRTRASLDETLEYLMSISSCFLAAALLRRGCFEDHHQ